MPGLIVEPEKKLLEDVHYDDMDDSSVDDDTDDSDVDTDDSDDDTEDSDDDKEDGIEERSLREELAELRKELADSKLMVTENFKQIFLMVEALTTKVLEILAQHSAGPSVSHEPGPTIASITVGTVVSKPDSISSSPAPTATTIAAIPPIELGNTHMPDATA